MCKKERKKERKKVYMKNTRIRCVRKKERKKESIYEGGKFQKKERRLKG